MKKIFLAFAAIFSVLASAQVTFRPVFRAGANFSHFTSGDIIQQTVNVYDTNSGKENVRTEFNSRTDFYFGIGGALKLSKVYTLQPEINYSRQGGKLVNMPYKTIFTYENGNVIDINSPLYPSVSNNEYIVSYYGLQIINKFNIKKFNIHLGPGLDFKADSNFKLESDVDLTFIGGVGFEIIKNLGIEARAKKGVIAVIDGPNGDYHTNVVFSLGATYKLDFK